MNLPGYDAWKLAGPPEWEGPTCDWCGGGEDLRVQSPAIGRSGPVLTCEECFTGADDGPCFDDLQSVTEYQQEQADMHADYLYEQRRDRMMEE